MRGAPGDPPVDQAIPPMQISASEFQYSEAQKLYILGAKLDNFRTVGPWHHVDAKYLDNMVYRLASPISRPCSRMHDEGAWAAEDSAFLHYPRPVSSIMSEPSRRTNRRGSPSAKSSYSLPTMGENCQLHGKKRYSRKSESPYSNTDYSEVDGIVNRVTRPTVASRGGVDIAEKFENKDYVYGAKTVSEEDLDRIVSRMTKPTVASTGGANIPRKYTDFVYGEKKVNQDEFDEIVNRMTKPTIASRGGVDIENKVPRAYRPPPTTKTNPVVPGLKEKQNRLLKRRVTAQELDDIVNRLNKLTPAYKAKYALNPHVWKDESPKGPAFNRQIAVA